MKLRYLILLTFMLCTSRMLAQVEYVVDLYDSRRGRVIPIAVYEPKCVDRHTKVVIFNHGYGQNAPDSYMQYSCLTKPLSLMGYYVISIQHELPNDPPLAMTGDFMETRMSNWERGVENIRFVIAEFSKLKSEFDWNNIAIMGHSNGGDMAMLFATKFPKMAMKIISLDHRRMRIPRYSSPTIYSLRGSDYEADKNVIPTTNELHELGITIVQLDGIKHGDMDNKGTKEQHDIILYNLYNFLK